MAKDNRLEIRIAARADQFEQALKKVEKDAKKASAQIADAFAKSGDGADILGKAVSGIEDAFAQSEEKGKAALQELANKASKGGQEIREAFIKAGKGIDEADKEAKQFVKAISDFAKAKSEARQLSNAFQDVEEQLKKTKSATDSLSSIELADRLSNDVGALSSRFEAAGERARDLRRDIRLAFPDPKNQQKYIKIAEDLRDKYGELIEVADFGKAIKRLDNLGSASEKNLERITKLALDAGRDLEDAADDLAEFLAPLESGNADFALLDETLRANFGIAAKALKQYGAEVDSNGKLIARTREQQRKAQKALKDYIDESARYANIAGRSKDGQDKLADATEKFNKSVGDQVTAFKNTIAEGILPYIDDLNGLSDNTKAAIGITASATSAIASFGAKTLEMGAYFKLAGGNLTPLTAGITKLAARSGLSVAALGGVVSVIGISIAVIGKAVYEYKRMTDSVQEVEKAEVSLANTRARILRDDRSKFVQKNVESIIKETDAIEDAGKRRAAIQDAILAKEEAARLYQDRGFKDRAVQLKADADQLKRQRNSYDADTAAVAKAEAEKTAARKRAYDDAVEAFNEFKLKTQRGEFESSEAALRALTSLSSGLDGDALKEANAERRNLQKDALKDALDSAKAQAQAGKITVTEFERQSKTLIQKYQARGQALKETERDVTEFVKSQNEQRYQAALAYENQLIQINQQRIAEARSAANPELEAIQRRLAKGEEVEAQAKAILAQENKVNKSLVDQDAAIQRILIAREKEAELRKDALTGGDNSEAIAKIAAEREKSLNEQVARQKAELDRKLAIEKESLDESAAKKRAAADLKQIEIALQRYELEKQASTEAFELRRQQIDEEERLGQDVGQKRIDLEKEIVEFKKKALADELKREIDIITAKRDSANVGATESQKKVNNAQAELDIEKAKLKVQQDAKDLADQDLQKAREKTDEIQKQIDKQEKLNDEVEKGFRIVSSFGDVTQGIEGLTSGFGEGFGQNSLVNKDPENPDATEEKKASKEDLRRAEARAKVAEIEAKERARGEKEKSAPVDDSQRPQLSKPGQEGQSAAEAYAQQAQASANQQYSTDPQLTALQQQHVVATQQGNQKLDGILRALTTMAQQGTSNRNNDGTNLARGTEPTGY